MHVVGGSEPGVFSGVGPLLFWDTAKQRMQEISTLSLYTTIYQAI
jgi:hypothetical protein